MTHELIPPLGGQGLKPLLAPVETRAELARSAAERFAVPIAGRAWGDLIMLGIGGFTPLEGFMKRADWQSVCRNMTLADGTFWPLPIILDVPGAALSGLKGSELTLTCEGRPVALMELEEVWRPEEEDLWEECRLVFKGQGPDSADFDSLAPLRHPGVRGVLGRERVCLGGRLTVLNEGIRPDLPDNFMITPARLREIAGERGWKHIACLQMRNPPHRSHEHLARIALETADALLVHTPMGALKPGDLPVGVRLQCLRALLDTYLPAERVILAGYPLDMRYAGPREALLHAAFRQNYGVAAQIVGRDHAGVGDFYAPFEAQEIFDHLPGADDPAKSLLTRPLKLAWAFYCKKCGGMASLNTSPHTMEDRIFHSGSLLRKSFAENTPLPPESIRPEVFRILADYYRQNPPEENIVLYGAAAGGALKGSKAL